MSSFVFIILRNYKKRLCSCFGNIMLRRITFLNNELTRKISFSVKDLTDNNDF